MTTFAFKKVPFYLGKAIFAALLMSGCGGKDFAEETRFEPVAPPAESHTQFVPYRIYPLGELAEEQPLTVSVRLSDDQEEFQHGDIGTGEAIVTGTGFLGLGTGAALLAPAAGGAMVGGIIILPLGVYIGAKNDVYAAQIRQAYREVDFPARVRDRLNARLVRSDVPPRAGPSVGYQLEVTIGPYGLIGSCFGYEGALAVRSGGELLFKDEMLWSSHRRSEDLPPVRCADFWTFAEDDARLMRKTLIEASEIIAEAILDRLQVPS